MDHFQEKVIDRSFSKPVVVDFWAPWCGPCRVLGPVIEQLAEEQSEDWELVKINTEEDPQTAQQYQIRSIPNVKMFHKGEVVAEFAGALPRSAIEKWLTDHLPDDRKEAFHELASKFASVPSQGKLEDLISFVAANPTMVAARVLLAQQIVFEKSTEALQYVEEIRMGEEFYDQASDIRVLANFMMSKQEDRSPIGIELAKTQSLLLNKQLEEAAESLIQAVTLDKSYQGDLPRKLAISIFRLLGNQHPVTKNFRWKFDMALY